MNILDFCEVKEPENNINMKGYKVTPWFKNCPKCSRLQYYSKPHYLTRAIKENKLCNSCNKKGIPSKAKLNLVGQSFGRLKVISAHENTSAGKPRWNCKCQPELGGCGNECVAS